MRQRMNHAVRHPLRLAVKAVALAVLIALVARAAYAQGVRHTIETACPYIDGPVIMIDYEGEVHEYDLV